jgi:glycosyltransferase involved in cell wall biosynthesis
MQESYTVPKVSVVIPCYNQGRYIEDSIQSVLDQTFDDYEIIIVNDGSTDDETNKLLSIFYMPKTKIVHTANQGLVAARNAGIAAACGEYILPLDADDRIATTYLEKGVAILDGDPAIGVVYGWAEYFGSRTGRWELPDFSPVRLLVENMVYCTALFRRRDWQKVGGYDPAMRYGWEDWELWLSLSELGIGFVRIPEVLFHYRVRSDSMTSSMRFWQKFLMMGQMVLNHCGHYTRTLCRCYVNINFSSIRKPNGY